MLKVVTILTLAALTSMEMLEAGTPVDSEHFIFNALMRFASKSAIDPFATKLNPTV
tara:strand:- start:2585 stop:2752 length:168 start_codon:yes stop_codon:yes gene_type:complete